MQLQEEYIVGIIYSHTKRPKYVKSNKTYNFECPVCNEGSSSGKKRRGFYIPAQNIIHCHNCDWHSQPLKWIQAVTGMNYKQICDENRQYIGSADAAINYYNANNRESQENKRSFTLPVDSINLLSDIETRFYTGDPRVRKGMDYIHSRRLDTARYRPKAIYFSVKDKIYSDCVCFPFFNINNKIDYFQVRELDPNAKVKYRGATGEKSLFNANKIDSSFLYIFLFEGPIDAMFIRNSVAMAGRSLTAKQESTLSMFPLHRKIWCLDNQQVDETSRKLSAELLEKGESVFYWPHKYKQFKDINDLCCRYNLDEISPTFIIDNTYTSKMQLIAAGLKI